MQGVQGDARDAGGAPAQRRVRGGEPMVRLDEVRVELQRLLRVLHSGERHVQLEVRTRAIAQQLHLCACESTGGRAGESRRAAGKEEAGSWWVGAVGMGAGTSRLRARLCSTPKRAHAASVASEYSRTAYSNDSRLKAALAFAFICSTSEAWRSSWTDRKRSMSSVRSKMSE